jgi:hypothetical protein
MMIKKVALLILIALSGRGSMKAQTVQDLLTKVRAKVAQVTDYSADARLDVAVSFIKIPESVVKVYYKGPDQFRIKKDGGISILPKGGLTVSLGVLLAPGNFAAIDAGPDTAQGVTVQVVKLVPLKETGDVVLTTLYIDVKRDLVLKAVTTTRNNGTYEIELQYGRYSGFALPDRAVFTFNTSGYKLPKGLALEYDPGTTPEPAKVPADAKGKIILTYVRYVVNKGVPAEVFQ